MALCLQKKDLDKKLETLEDLVNIEGADNEMSGMKIHHFENQKNRLLSFPYVRFFKNEKELCNGMVLSSDSIIKGAIYILII